MGKTGFTVCCRSTVVLLLFLVCTAQTALAGRVRISGRITDENGQPVELATVNEDRTMQSAISDMKGRYLLIVTVPGDTVRLTFRMMGHETRRRTLVSPADSVTLDIMLPSIGYSLESVDISDTRRQTTAMQELSPEGLRFSPGPNGASVESLIQSQAGVSTHNELSSQYSVRGGNFDENSVYVNGTEIFRPMLVRAGQQEGLSFINPDMVESVRFSSGGFDASYSDRMSSVLDISYRRPKGFESVISASLLGASAYLGGGTDKFSAMAGIRYKNTRSLLGTLDTQGEYEPKFLDIQTSLAWTPDKSWDLEFIGNIARNNYRFTPTTRSTTFGTMKEPHHFLVYFDGWENDCYNTFSGAFDVKRKFGSSSVVRLSLAAFGSRENESFDITSQYWLDESGATDGLSVGTFTQHARNRMNTGVRTAAISGTHRTPAAGTLQWGAEYRLEKVTDHMREWEMHDSAGYTLPYTVDGPMQMVYSLASDQAIGSSRKSGYIMDTYRTSLPGGLLTINAGVRASHWSWNNELIVSPRVTLGYNPESNDALTFRFSTGVYYQSPFYKEFKDTVSDGVIYRVVLNSGIRSQRSLQFVLGGDYDFRVFDRPFKFTAEIYYKDFDYLIPYDLDNVRIVYCGENCAKGYAAGLDMKLFGEFVPGTQSWLTLSLMNTREKIAGQWLPRPTDQRYNMSLYFTDTFPRREYWKMSLRCSMAGGLPFGPTHGGRARQVFRAPAYKRVDIGLAYRIFYWNNHPHIYGKSAFFKNAWLGVDCLNLLGINNVSSYCWITDVSGTQFAVPNYLSGRQLNLRLTMDLGK